MQALEPCTGGRTRRKNRIAAVYLLLSLVMSCLCAEAGATQQNGPPVPPAQGRILIITIDSLPKDMMFSDCMPFISSCRKRGAWGTSKVASIPLSISGTKAIFTGRLSGPLDIIDDFSSSRGQRDSFVTRASRQGKRVALFNFLLKDICPDVASFKPKSLLFSQYREEADDVFSQAYRFLRQDTWDVAAVSTYGLDHVGHLETPRSPRFTALARTIDDRVRQLIRLTGDRDTVLITSEHGMNGHGFHMDQSPAVLDTGFVLWGPSVKKGGPAALMQIDWAPTLSVLAGVPPLYDSPALPALHVLSLPDAANTRLLGLFSSRIAGSPRPLSYGELQQRRVQAMTTKIPPGTGMLILSAVVALLIGLVYIVVPAAYPSKTAKRIALSALLAAALIIISWLLSVSNLFPLVTGRFPFSMNFISAHPVPIILLLAAVIGGALLYSRRAGNNQALLLLFASSAFLCIGSFDPFSWVIFVILPVAAWAASRDKTWGVVLVSLWAGLLIRRLTFYKAHAAFTLPDRWMICASLLAAGAAYSWLRRGKTFPTAVTAAKGTAYSLPALLVIMFIPGIETRALLLAVCLIPLLIVPTSSRTLPALWAAFFYLGTSSNINHLTQITAFPLFLAAWSIADRSSDIAKGMMIGFVLWALYLLPGNSLNLNISDIHDPYILSQVNKQDIISTVLVIAGRYVLPLTVLAAVMTRTLPRIRLFTVAAAALIPFLAATGALYAKLLLFPVDGYPWQEITSLTILSVYLVVVSSALLLSGLLRLVQHRLLKGKPPAPLQPA